MPAVRPTLKFLFYPQCSQCRIGSAADVTATFTRKQRSYATVANVYEAIRLQIVFLIRFEIDYANYFGFGVGGKWGRTGG
jgi:hypothetical protein